MKGEDREKKDKEHTTRDKEHEVMRTPNQWCIWYERATLHSGAELEENTQWRKKKSSVCAIFGYRFTPSTLLSTQIYLHS